MKIGSIVWGVKDMARSIEFWQQALNYELAFEPEDDFAILQPKDADGIYLSLNLVTSEKARRHHMDIYSDTPEEDVRRLIALGATRKDWNYHEGEDYTVLEDPDGNPFCIIPKTECF